MTIDFYLTHGEKTKPGKRLIKIANNVILNKKDKIDKLKYLWSINGLRYINLQNSNKDLFIKVFKKRTVNQIINSGYYCGCSDLVTVFVTLSRLCGIPAKYVEGVRLGKHGAHCWTKLYMGGKWINVDVSGDKFIIGYDYKNKIYGPYKILSESLDSSDSKITCYKDWIKYKYNVL